MIPSKGRTVTINLTDEQRAKLGGNHSDDAGRVKTAPAIIVNVWNNDGTAATEDTLVNLKVWGDSENNAMINSYTPLESYQAPAPSCLNDVIEVPLLQLPANKFEADHTPFKMKEAYKGRIHTNRVDKYDKASVA